MLGCILLPSKISTGVPVSEMKTKQSTQIRVLSQEEIDGMRVVCKVSVHSE